MTRAFKGGSLADDFDRRDAIMASMLGVTPDEWRILRALWKLGAIPTTELATEAYNDGRTTRTKTTQVALAKMRKKVAKHGITIPNLTGYGYILQGESKTILDQLWNKVVKETTK